MKIAVSALLFALLGLSVGVAAANTPLSAQFTRLLNPDDTRIMSVDGLEESLTLEQIAARADVIVVGIAAADRVRTFRDNAAIPVEARDPRIYARASYHDMTFQVLEYVKGSGPVEISVRWLASSPGLRIESQPAPVLQPARQYVLLLNRGSGVWTGGYTVLGRRGAGELAGTQATFAEYGTLHLDQVRKAAGSIR